MLVILREELGAEFSKKKPQNTKMGEISRSDIKIKDLQGRINRIKQLNKKPV